MDVFEELAHQTNEAKSGKTPIKGLQSTDGLDIEGYAHDTTM